MSGNVVRHGLQPQAQPVRPAPHRRMSAKISSAEDDGCTGPRKGGPCLVALLPQPLLRGQAPSARCKDNPAHISFRFLTFLNFEKQKTKTKFLGFSFPLAHPALRDARGCMTSMQPKTKKENTND
jgi:hypothetical protein